MRRITSQAMKQEIENGLQRKAMKQEIERVMNYFFEVLTSSRAGLAVKSDIWMWMIREGTWPSLSPIASRRKVFISCFLLLLRPARIGLSDSTTAGRMARVHSCAGSLKMWLDHGPRRRLRHVPRAAGLNLLTNWPASPGRLRHWQRAAVFSSTASVPSRPVRGAHLPAAPPAWILIFHRQKYTIKMT